jgi:hypothetical protein
MNTPVRVIRAVVIAVLGYALYCMLVFVSVRSFEAYTHPGNNIAFVAILLFSAFAWWYGEDRDRRRAARAAASGESASVNGHGH